MWPWSTGAQLIIQISCKCKCSINIGLWIDKIDKTLAGGFVKDDMLTNHIILITRKLWPKQAMHNAPAVNQDAPVVKIVHVIPGVATGAYYPKLEFENHKNQQFSWKSHDKIDHLRLV